MHIYLMDFALVSWVVSPQYTVHIPLLIAYHYSRNMTLSPSSSTESIPQSVTSDPCRELRPRYLSDLFKQLPSPWSPNQAGQRKFGLFRTSHIHSTLLTPYPPLIQPSILTSTHARRAPLLPYACSSGSFPQGHKQQCMTWQRRTE